MARNRAGPVRAALSSWRCDLGNRVGFTDVQALPSWLPENRNGRSQDSATRGPASLRQESSVGAPRNAPLRTGRMPGAETALVLLPSLLFRGATPGRSVDLTGGHVTQLNTQLIARPGTHRICKQAPSRQPATTDFCPNAGRRPANSALAILSMSECAAFRQQSHGNGTITPHLCARRACCSG